MKVHIALQQSQDPPHKNHYRPEYTNKLRVCKSLLLTHLHRCGWGGGGGINAVQQNQKLKNTPLLRAQALVGSSLKTYKKSHLAISNIPGHWIANIMLRSWKYYPFFTTSANAFTCQTAKKCLGPCCGTHQPRFETLYVCATGTFWCALNVPLLCTNRVTSGFRKG